MERMLARVAAALAAVAAPIAAPAWGQATPEPPVSAVPVDATATDTALSLGIADTRMTVPVSIGSRGPWHFIIDTGAERTVVSRELAASLGLAGGPPLRVLAMAGPSATASVIVPELSISTLSQPAITAPALEARNLGAPGLLGIDALQGHSVDIDFDKSAMTVRPSRRHAVASGNHGDEIVVIARSVFGQLIVTDARWRGRRIAVVLDTGSSISVGNPAMLAMLSRHAKSLGPATAVSVTGATLHAQSYLIDSLNIGGIGFANVPVAFADAAPFHRFGLEKRPALMLGMDALRLFRRVRIDFANRAVEFTLPRNVERPILPG